MSTALKWTDDPERDATAVASEDSRVYCLFRTTDSRWFVTLSTEANKHRINLIRGWAWTSDEAKQIAETWERLLTSYPALPAGGVRPDLGPPSSAAFSNSAQWAVSAATKFRQVARDTENPSTKQLAEGLTHLAEAIQALDQSK
ncbi:hypothetical protein [Mycobacterium antarcticum]|uniref:hypothetical protein n=1 Tax=Mycolicibacterium sp. TUM20984 TaxID=3023368 RepID=UPI0023A60870|nr:hypothetical protein [Mycolicibacterium sp. TUM20984]GLP83581.1 hypothetical protein TUM20984_50010 [Mycolicibacterium sp. TUM20984]